MYSQFFNVYATDNKIVTVQLIWFNGTSLQMLEGHL